MSSNTSFSRRLFWEADSRHSTTCYKCSKKFRSGERRRHLEIDVSLCIACHRSHAHFLSSRPDLEDDSVVDVNIYNNRIVSDVAVQTDFDFFDQETSILTTTTPSHTINQESVASDFDSDTIRLPFLRVSKSSTRCFICPK